MTSIKKQKDAKNIRTLGNIQNQTGRLQELVEDLLDVSRLQTGKMMFRKNQFRMDELIKEVIEGIQETTKQKIVFSKHTPTTIFADRFRITQVLTNLITNAIKYSSETGDIRVSLLKKDELITVSVNDSGIGISHDQQKKIFERLYQAMDDKEKTFPGLGMGLYISQQIIKRHRGKIWVESEKGKGSTFYFTLPVR